MGRDDAPLPVHVAGRGMIARARADSSSSRSAAISRRFFGRDRSDLEPALPLGDDRPFGREPIEQLAQGADARAVVLAQAVSFSFSGRSEPCRR